MLGLLIARLEAHEDSTNCHRAYTIEVGQDLFGAFVIAVRYGRVGARGRVQLLSAGTIGDAQGIVLSRLRRRLTAFRRIGCRYRLTEAQGVAEPIAAGWFPEEYRRELAANADLQRVA